MHHTIRLSLLYNTRLASYLVLLFCFLILHILLVRLDGPLETTHHHYSRFYPHNQLLRGINPHHIVKIHPKVLVQIKYIYAKPSGNIPTHLFHPRNISESDVPQIIVE